MARIYLSTEMTAPTPQRHRPAQAAFDPDALKLWVVLARAFAYVEAWAGAHVARYRLTLGEFGVLEALYHKGPLLLGELQRKILVSSGGVTYLVDRLERRGFVARRRVAEDARARQVVLTPEGRTLIQRVFPEHAAELNEALGGLSPRDRRVATALLRRLGTSAAERRQEAG